MFSITHTLMPAFARLHSLLHLCAPSTWHASTILEVFDRERCKTKSLTEVLDMSTYSFCTVHTGVRLLSNSVFVLPSFSQGSSRVDTLSTLTYTSLNHPRCITPEERIEPPISPLPTTNSVGRAPLLVEEKTGFNPPFKSDKCRWVH